MRELLLLVGVFAGSLLVGYLLIRRVPPLLHTPLMSMTNGISAVTLLGGLLLFAGEPDTREVVLGTVALAAAAFNLLGGLAITDRMLSFFRKG
jgi:NAD(P) transhydrogenase subunit alpha